MTTLTRRIKSPGGGGLKSGDFIDKRERNSNPIGQKKRDSLVPSRSRYLTIQTLSGKSHIIKQKNVRSDR